MKQYQKKLDQLYTEFSSGENGLSTEQTVKNFMAQMGEM